MVIWKIALSAIQDVRGSIAMYLFIIEESLQTVGMACYLNSKEGNWQKVLDISHYAISQIVDPAIEFNDAYGKVAYPLNMAYSTFYNASKIQYQNYIEMAQLKLAEE